MIRPTVRALKREKITGGEPWKPSRPLDLMLKTVFDQPHIAKNVAYGLYFYGIMWILISQGRFMVSEFGNDFFRSFRTYFSVGACIVWKQVYFFGFCTEWVSVDRCFIYILVFVTLLLFIMVSWGRRGGVQLW